MSRLMSLVCVLCTIFSLACLEVDAGAQEGSSSSESSVVLAKSPLVVTGAESLVGGSQAEEEVRRANPEAVREREESETEYSGLSPSDGQALADRTFPGLSKEADGGLPSLSPGEKVTEYMSAHAARVSLPDGSVGVVESLGPLAARDSGSWVALDLGLSSSSGGYSAKRSDAAVRLPGNIAEGVQLPGAGVSLIPLSAGSSQQATAATQGSLDGYALFWGGVSMGVDVDLMGRLTPAGADLVAILRSQASPEQLRFKVMMPPGATLVQDSLNIIGVVDAGRTLATIGAPTARDAQGTEVPLTLTVSGNDVVSMTVEHKAGQWTYPIMADPEINDSQLATTNGGKRSNWEFWTSNSAKFGHSMVYESAGKEHLETSGIAEYTTGDWAYWGYETKGNSKIYELKTKTTAKNKGSKIESFLEFEASGASEKPKKVLSTELSESEYSEKPTSICAWNASKVEECLPGAGKEKNAVHFQQTPTGSPGSGYKFSDILSEGIVSISEPAGTHATAGFNAGSIEVEGEVEVEGKKIRQKRANALYGAGAWLSKNQGALELIAKDSGIGVSATGLEYENAGKWEQLSEHSYLEKENGCQGVQCFPEHKEYWTLDPKLPDGEDKIRYRSEEAMAGTKSLESEGVATVKVDTKKPYNIALNGLPPGNELAERPYKLTAAATDGEGAVVASSGVKSIKLFISGREITETGHQTGCVVPKGECTASAEWSINGAELGAGHHAIVIVAIDNAGNEERLEETLSIHHSTPVALGPGSVDLQSGDFAMGGPDVSMGSGLTVSRNYSSRDLTQGAEGPLGPDWSIGLSSSESLVEMVDGSVLLTSATGSQSIFASLGEGKFEPPTGDSNLQLTLEENKETKQKLAYYLKDVAAGTSVKFTLPSGGTEVWVPTRQEGTVATDTVTWAYQTVGQHAEYPLPSESSPYAIATGPDGRLWFVDRGTNKIGKITSTGYVMEYALPSGSAPCSMTRGPDENLWFTDCGTGKVGKITTTGVITEYSLPLGGEPTGITEGFDGQLWVANHSLKTIDKVETRGVVSAVYNEGVSGNPESITRGPDGRLWFTSQEGEKGKFGAITTSGSVEEYPAATLLKLKPRQIVTGPDGNLWSTEEGNTNLDRITTSGSVTQYTGTSGGEAGITVGTDRNLWMTAAKSSKILKVTPPVGEGGLKVSEYAEPEGSEPWAITEGPERNLWYTDLKSNKIAMITTSGTVTRPTEALAPVPAKVECPTGKLQPGCRALKFVYATETTAKGESESEWGDYAGHLKRVLFEAYNPASKKVEEPGVSVAEYRYDQLGRLRSEWDPRTSSLKTTYSYDEEGHLTALEQPGQEPWLLTYGTTSGDMGNGRLLALTRPSASTPLGVSPRPVNSEAPKLSTTSPSQGVELSTTTGAWSNSPASYSYQWERCAISSGACSTITGATNKTYVPTTADVEEELLVQVSATNSGGTATVFSSMTGRVVQLPSYNSQFGGVGSGNGQMKSPAGVALDSAGHVWVADTANHRVQEFSSAGGYLTQFGSEGTGHGQFKESLGIAIDRNNNIWVSDQANNNIQEFNEKHEWVRTISSWKEGSPPFEKTINLTSPRGLAIDLKGNIWVTEGSKTVVELSETGEHIKNVVEWTVELFKKETFNTPSGVAIDPNGAIWVADTGNDRIVEFNSTGSEYLRQFGTAGTGNGQFKEPKGIAMTKNGQIWVTDTLNSRMQKFTSSGEYLATVGSLGTGNGQFTEPRGAVLDSSGNMWGADMGNNRVEKFAVPNNTNPPPPPPLGSSAVTTLEYGVPLTAGSGLRAMTSTEVAKWGQKDDPVEATAIMPPDSPQGWPASSYTRATVYYLDGKGRTTNVSTPSTAPYGSISTTEYEEESNDAIRTLSPDNRQTALEAGSTKSVEVSTLLSTIYTYASKCSKPGEPTEERESIEFGTRLCETEGPQHTIKYTSGKEQKEALARRQTRYFYDEHVPAGEPYAKETYNLLTEKAEFAELANREQVEVRTTKTSYAGQENLGWKLRASTSVTEDPEGKKITQATLYNKLTGQIIETRSPAGQSGGSAHDSKIVYYTSEENKEGYPVCGNQPEWSGLICETLPAKQPGTNGVPNLPVTTTTYNMWNEPETVTETFPASEKVSEATRTKKETYDEAGRLTGSETTSTSSVDKSLPKVTDEYNTATGMLEKQSTTVESKTATITSKYSRLSQLVEYTDADGNTATYRYGGPENDGLVEEMTDGSNGGKAKQTYTYNTTTKQLEELSDSSAEKFTATYDAEGKLTSEVYPNGMCANTAYNSISETTHIEYIKTTNCAESKPTVWFNETRTPSVRGETFTRNSMLANETYSYDTVGRLTETQETPAGEGCSVRIYAYDEESSRLSLTKRTPGAEGKCATEGGAVENHTYDEANRMTDTGIEYDPLGNIKKLSGADAEGHELTTTFYVDNAVASQTQNGVTNQYKLDPTGRVRETTTGATSVITHYDGPGEAVAWTNESVEKWTRNIPGIDGTLQAVQTNGGTPVLQLHDLQGNIFATAVLSKEATKLLSTYNSTEFGVPNKEKAPPPYAWLGAGYVASALSSGVITYGAASYVPQTGRALQSEQVEPPGAPGGTGVGAPYVSQEEPWNMQGAAREATEAPGLEAGREREASKAALEGCISEGCEDLPGVTYSAEEEGDSMASVADLGRGDVKLAAEVGACNYMRWSNRHDPKNAYYFNNNTYEHCQYLYKHDGTDPDAILARKHKGGFFSISFHLPSLQDFACAAMGVGIAMMTDGTSLAVSVAAGSGGGVACAAIGPGK